MPRVHFNPGATCSSLLSVPRPRGRRDRVKATLGGSTTVYVGNYYEKEGSTVRKYYYAGGARLAMREAGTLYYLLTDHLGSTAITINSAGTSEVGELRYYAYGKTRYSSGTTPTDRRFTGQIEDAYNFFWRGI
jgi:hypothetical protein